MPGLKSFIKGSRDPKDRMPGCCNYDLHHVGCFLLDHMGQRCDCKPLKDQRCGYFERAVLPTANLLKLKDRQKIMDEYQRAYGLEKLVKIELSKTHTCPCGNPIPSRMRFCNVCKKKKRQKTKREYQKRFRLSHRSTVAQKSPL